MKTKDKQTSAVRWFADLDNNDVPSVGGKNASLGEMIRSLKKQKVRVPDGFATTAEAYWQFLEANEIKEKIAGLLDDLRDDEIKLEEAGRKIRRLFAKGEFPEKIREAIEKAYAELSKKYQADEVDVAVRSSATAEDLPDASFAGQQETFLNVSGADELMEACRKCYASLFTNRAISYREEKGFDHMKVALSVGVQKMVRSDKACSGVMFSIDTETGFPNVVMISGAWGLGENVVKGTVKEITEARGTAEYWHLVVSSEAKVKKVFSEILDRFDSIDVLVNNAGISGTTKPTHEITEEEWDKVMAVNVKGVFLCTKHALPTMRNMGGGSIINLSSIYGIVGAPDLPAYHASKGAVRLMTKTDALLYAKDKIRVNSVHPGFIRTPLVEELGKNSDEGVEKFRKHLDSRHPIGHVGEPEDVAWGIVYLASDESKFVTGSELVIDGGYTAQ